MLSGKAFVPPSMNILSPLPRQMLHFLLPRRVECSLQLPYKETINLNFSSQGKSAEVTRTSQYMQFKKALIEVPVLQKYFSSTLIQT